jgi:hypothetical protein
MSRGARVVRAAAVAAVACFAALAVLAMGWLEPVGHKIFDSHLRGYDPETARAYLTALTADQTALYLGLFRGLDTVFPALAAFALGGVIWLNTRGLPVAARLLLLLAPAAYLVMDYAENAMVARMLRGGPQVFEATILQASAFTTTKWIMLTAAGIVAVWAWRLAPKGPSGGPQ